MNRLTITIISFIMAMPTIKAQSILALSNNGFRDGDSLAMTLVDGVVPGDAGRNVVWDYSNARKWRLHTLQYKLMGDTLSAHEGGTSWHTVINGDTLLLTGFENRHTLMEYDEPLPLLRYPFSFGDSIGGSFHGIGKWCDRTFMHIWGDGVTRADAKGTLILPSGDTLRHVLRLHSVRRTWHISYDTIYTWSALREFVRQEERIGLEMAISKTAPIVTDNYVWYAPGWRYPVLRMETATDAIGTRMTALLYPPASQGELDYDMENDQSRRQMAMRGGVGFAGDKRDDPPNAITSHAIGYDASNGIVNLTFSLSRPALVSLLLSDVAGVTWRSTEKSYDGDGTYTLSLSCSGIPHGQYALRIICGNDIISEKFYIK